ncbi:HPr family phosphocarrier protein [Ensifer sp. LC163]|uniref:HPr family phosphocarrier protein n=1 Tax=Ensifer sp. LC163 TaxID=1120652 RepID=UPI00081345B9|nr:HPr family phosphocarrier protein [Ensifer sp. LC163]OCP37333.1 phosphate ABC transporter permease [Ensifer sp. LC163]
MMDHRPDMSLTRELLIVNKRGLHARASAKFVQTVEAYDAEITVSKDGSTVGGTSIMGLMMLAASTGSSVYVTASGVQAEEALNALDALVRDKFGEEM